MPSTTASNVTILLRFMAEGYAFHEAATARKPAILFADFSAMRRRHERWNRNSVRIPSVVTNEVTIGTTCVMSSGVRAPILFVPMQNCNPGISDENSADGQSTG